MVKSVAIICAVVYGLGFAISGTLYVVHHWGAEKGLLWVFLDSLVQAIDWPIQYLRLIGL